ncbi:hypothetical protein RF11_16176 [Thelohanellus kitauei]|uniref:Uncharacterized protein n=1 Tax=Thelohanellus kitauei TaxID=669202 RepID=A0A0C2N4H9_THEKT|nr:hypothetical protein RF11_16176 [Thelohanellus kitauei]
MKSKVDLSTELFVKDKRFNKDVLTIILNSEVKKGYQTKKHLDNLLSYLETLGIKANQTMNSNEYQRMLENIIRDGLLILYSSRTTSPYVYNFHISIHLKQKYG